MHALLASIGTDGDVFPYLGLGAALRSRGHRVTLLSDERFSTAAAGHGFGFRALLTDEEIHRVLSDPDFWHPLKSGLVAARWGASLIERQYQVIADVARDPDAVLVASPGVLAARLVEEKLGKPAASVILQPGLIPSISAPPVMPGGLTLPRWAPRPLGRLYWRGVNAAGDLLVGRELNRVRASLGLKPVRLLFEWWSSPQLMHHGGIGTVARALAAGTPQLIVPFAYDQPDNAVRVQRLGAGEWIRPRRASGRRIANALARLIEPSARERLRSRSESFGDGIAGAAGLIEQLTTRSGR